MKKRKSRAKGYTAMCPTQQRTKNDLTLYTQEVMRETETGGELHTYEYSQHNKQGEDLDMTQ